MYSNMVEYEYYYCCIDCRATRMIRCFDYCFLYYYV